MKKNSKVSAYSYNHSTNKIELKPILAYRMIKNGRIYKITLSS